MGKPSTERAHALAIRVYKLRESGCTSREIAELVGIKVEQVKARANLGARLVSAAAPITGLGAKEAEGERHE